MVMSALPVFAMRRLTATSTVSCGNDYRGNATIPSGCNASKGGPEDTGLDQNFIFHFMTMALYHSVDSSSKTLAF